MISQYRDFLVDIGLSDKEAAVYELLLNLGPTSVAQVAKGTRGVQRTNLYNVLYSLISKGLAEKIEGGKVVRFRALSPENLQKIIDTRAQETKNAQNTLGNVLSSLKSLYSVTTDRPSVAHLEGTVGLTKIYEDILKEKQDILLIRSVYDKDHPELQELLAKQVQRQVRAKIRVRAITPLVEHISKQTIKRDPERLLERLLVPKEKLTLPAQIIIYGDKVAVTDVKDTHISTVIDNKNIADTFRVLFEYLWGLGQVEHERLLKELSG
jgi:sugar-specific transcriptional regulator TrmB